MLAGVVVASTLGVEATVFYLVVYLFMNLAAFAVVVARERETALGDDIAAALGPRRQPPVARVADDDRDALAGRHPRHGRLLRQVLPDRRGGRRRLHLARRGDRDRLDDLARLLPAGGRGDVDAVEGDAGAAAATRGPRWPAARRRPTHSATCRPPPSPSCSAPPACSSGSSRSPLFDLAQDAGRALGLLVAVSGQSSVVSCQERPTGRVSGPCQPRPFQPTRLDLSRR